MSKKVIEPSRVLVNGDMSQATLVSASSVIKYMDNVSYQAVYSGSATGTFDVEVSHDGVNWSALGLLIPVSAGSPQFIDINQTGAAHVRFTYTRAAGTGTLNVTVTAKEI